MHLNFKTLDGKRHQLEIEASASISELKAALLSSLNLNVQRLVYNGRILEDAKAISEYNLKPEDTIIVMVNPVRPPPVVAPAPAEEEGEEEEEEEAEMDPVFEANLKGLVDMGFSIRLAARALSLGENDPARAIQLLTSGELGEDAPEAQEEGRENPLAFLLASPEFLQIRQQLLSNPNSITSFLQQLQTANPELHRMIQRNYEDFLGLLGIEAAEGEGEQGGTTVDLTEAEINSVKNLASLGFSMQDALEAYLSCDKNDEMAANLLFSNYGARGQQDDYDSGF